MNNIATIHEKILDYFISIRKNNPDFFFVPRRINNKNRLNFGYWFVGNDEYLVVSFWNGADRLEKVPNIGFVVYADKKCRIELSAQDSNEKAAFLKALAEELGGFQKQATKDRWNKRLEGTDYIALLEWFLSSIKPVIDKNLAVKVPADISFLDQKFHETYGQPVIERRQAQIDFGSVNKITRITWNTNNWRRPSGLEGKSVYDWTYEANNAFGHEEWLFDRTTNIDGYHYGFLQSLNLKSNKHVGKTYSITLFTINNLRKIYLVGEIKNIECISKEESTRVYEIYAKKGWIDRMARDLQVVNANVGAFMEMLPEEFFNIRFTFDNLIENEELEEISDEDINVTTNHFKLLPKKTTDIQTSQFLTEVPNPDDDSAGNKKNMETRKKVYKVECEYDPYHDMMQNCLFDLLNGGYEGYSFVQIEKTHVDIKAKDPSGKWHYFEIKTDRPKLCIRKALGQVMEYAYFPSVVRAEKLVVIGDSKPDADAIDYLKFVRGRFGLPIYYRALDLETNKLSDLF